MSGSVSSDVKAEPNLTPVLDMVFQLITFFMLVINFQSAEIDEKLELPVVGSARAVSTDGRTGLLVLNIDKEGNVRTTMPIRDIDSFLRIQSQAMLKVHGMTEEDLIEGKDIPTTVVIRADRATPFGKFNRVIKLCQDGGFRNFALRAYDKKPEKK